MNRQAIVHGVTRVRYALVTRSSSYDNSTTSDSTLSEEKKNINVKRYVEKIWIWKDMNTYMFICSIIYHSQDMEAT